MCMHVYGNTHTGFFPFFFILNTKNGSGGATVRTGVANMNVALPCHAMMARAGEGLQAPTGLYSARVGQKHVSSVAVVGSGGQKRSSQFWRGLSETDLSVFAPYMLYSACMCL